MREYILLVAKIDKHFGETVQQVIDGKITEIGYMDGDDNY